jgi:hypothetical protein
LILHSKSENAQTGRLFDVTSNLKTALTAAMETATKQAGLIILSTETGTDFGGKPTTIFKLALPADTQRTLQLQLSNAFDFNKPDLLPIMTSHLAEEAKRLQNPVPNAYVTLAGLPVTMSDFGWPFHRSTSGADTYIVHGLVHLADGTESPLHAKVSASMTVTFAEIVPAPEQPYAETFIYNAIRKTLDQGQLEMLRSGNRQPVPVTTRYYSRWQKKFFFTDSNATTQQDFLRLKVFWLSGILGENQPVWIADPRDAQYLNTTEADLVKAAKGEAAAGFLSLHAEYASATPKLMELVDNYRAQLEAALALTKPAFNEEMRAGHANM